MAESHYYVMYVNAAGNDHYLYGMAGLADARHCVEYFACEAGWKPVAIIRLREKAVSH